VDHRLVGVPLVHPVQRVTSEAIPSRESAQSTALFPRRRSGPSSPERFERGEEVEDPVPFEVDQVRDVQLPGDERAAADGKDHGLV